MNINLTSDPAAIKDRDAFILVEDNVQSIKILTDAGVLGLLKPKPPNNATYCLFQTDSHWCCGSYHENFAEAKENGYSVCMLPKTVMTIVEAHQFFGEVIAETSGKKQLEFAIVEIANHESN